MKTILTMERVAIQYLSHLNIPVSEKYFKKCMLSHPAYPSLLSIADTLERLGINHQIGKIKKEKLEDIPFPYILQLDKGGGELLLVKDEQELHGRKDDLEHWKGVFIKAEPTAAIADQEHNRQYATEKLLKKASIVLAAALAGLVIVPALQAVSWLHFLLLATSISGAVVGYLLIAKDLGVTYRPVESFCNAGKRTNCDRILNAKDAQLLSFFSFSDAVISYFVFQLIIVGLFIPLLQGPDSFVLVLAAASLFTIPVIGYSLYYQQVKTKIWCRLCVIIDAILGIQVILFTVMYLNQFFALTDIALLPVIIALLLFAAIASSVMLFKNRLEAANDSSRAETAAKRVKYDPEVFTHLLIKEEKVDIIPFEQEIRIGDGAAPVQIMMVVNLHCNPCRVAYKAVTQLLAAYPGKVCFYIRLTPGMNKAIESLSSSTYVIRYWQHHIHGQQDESMRTQKFLHHWYDEMNPEAFANRYPTNRENHAASNGSENLESRHYRWIDNNSIISTPTFFVNGYRLPKSYNIKDLMALVPSLAANFQEKKMKKKLQGFQEIV